MMVWYVLYLDLSRYLIFSSTKILLQEINNPETIENASPNDISITELSSLYVHREILEAEPDYKFVISIDDVLLPEQPGDYHNFFGEFT